MKKVVAILFKRIAISFFFFSLSLRKLLKNMEMSLQYLGNEPWMF